MTSQRRTFEKQGFVFPQHPRLREFYEKVESGVLKKSNEDFSNLTHLTSVDRLWIQYLNGLRFLQLENDFEAIKCFEKIYSTSKSRFVEIVEDAERITGLSLKQLGLIHRRNKNFEKAYYFHQIAYEYFRNYGSVLEAHDAIIQIDFDCYYLQDLKLSEFWLKKSMELLNELSNPLDRIRCLAISSQNLASTLLHQKQYDRAEKEMLKALDAWIEYESYFGPSEGKVIKAYESLGDFYEMWGQSLRSLEQNFIDTMDRSRQAYETALKWSEKRNHSEADQENLKEKMRSLDHF